MESNSRSLALEMNESEKNGPSDEVSFQFVLEILKSEFDLLPFSRAHKLSNLELLFCFEKQTK